ncbi:MAG: hypothetical protein AAF756_22575 [Pseudomonadota bacterium]
MAREAASALTALRHWVSRSSIPEWELKLQAGGRSLLALLGRTLHLIWAIVPEEAVITARPVQRSISTPGDRSMPAGMSLCSRDVQTWKNGFLSLSLQDVE